MQNVSLEFFGTNLGEPGSVVGTYDEISTADDLIVHPWSEAQRCPLLPRQDKQPG